MVKNKGGGKAKKIARKHVKLQDSQSRKTRLSNDKLEVYAVVKKLYGNGRVLVLCNDGIERNCIIRKKFRGKNKQYNQVSGGTIVLVGLRDWENHSTDKKQTCDLLEVYSFEDRTTLKQQRNIQWRIIEGENLKEKEEIIDFIDMPSFSDDEDDSIDDGECESSSPINEQIGISRLIENPDYINEGDDEEEDEEGEDEEGEDEEGEDEEGEDEEYDVDDI